MAEADAIQRMQVWWLALDPTTKDILEQLYARDKEGVLPILSGGNEVAAREGTLASFLDGDAFEAMHNIPRVEKASELAIDPAAPDSNQAFTVSWTETNGSNVDCQAYTDLIQVLDQDNAVQFTLSIDRPALAAGESVDASAQVTGLPMASYNVFVTMNSDGIDHGTGQPTAQGFKTYASAPVGVGGADVSGRPGSAWEADIRAVSDAYAQLYSAYSSRGEESLAAVSQALYAFASAVDPGGVATDEDTYANDLMVSTIRRAQLLEGIINRGFFEQRGADSEQQFNDEVLVALQAIYPASIDQTRLRASANEIQAAIMEIGRQSLGIF